MTYELLYNTIIIIKRISRAPICCTRWEHRALYNNTNNRHAHTHALDKGIATAVKNSLEIIIEQVRLEGSFKRGGKISGGVFEANCMRQFCGRGYMCVGHIKFYVCRTYELLYNTTACDTVLRRGIYVHRPCEPLYSTLSSGVSTADAEIKFPSVLTMSSL